MNMKETIALPPDFSPELYLSANPDVAAAGVDAIEHYLEYGHAEGRMLRPRVERPLKELLEEGAAPFGVCDKVHPEDHLLHFFRSHFRSDEEAARQYFGSGRQDAIRFSDLVAQYPASTVLEFASGYGRMTRHMAKVAPHLEMTVCDIHPAANRFVSENMGIPSIASASIPEEFHANREYDLTFALSLFSHLPESTWTRWLSALLGTVKVGGIVAFTTHGRVTAKQQDIDINSGFVFRDISEQADIDLAQYGTTYVTTKWAFEQINSLEARIVDFIEGHWWGHQDLYVIQRTSR